MAFYVEEEVWKCPKHPSKRRRSGICPICLRDRLVTLCPRCANVRPCACCSSATTSSSPPSSYFSLFSSASKSDRASSSNLSDPAFRRSRSLAFPFLRSRFSGERDAGDPKSTLPTNRSKSLFWSLFKSQSKSKSGDLEREDEELKKREIEDEDDEYAMSMMIRSRSVSVPVASNSVAGDGRSSPAKGKGWHFRSPIKGFRHSKNSKVVQEQSPLSRG